MKFRWTTVRVSNMEASLQFYQEILGLEISHRFPTGPGREIVFLGDGDTKVELMDTGVEDIPDTGKDISMGFQTDSLEQTIALVKEKGYALMGEPVQPAPGLQFVFVSDPDGYKIQILQES